MDYYDTLSGIKNNEGGGGSPSPVIEEASLKDVNFYDYDGTRLYSYSAQEWANVTELPANPSHSGLVAQGWNWTKAEIDAQLLAIPDFPVHIGQHYVTESGDTEIDIELVDEFDLSPYINLGINGTVVIDWGDGNTSTLTGTNTATKKNMKHDYAQPGKYTIKISRTSGSYLLGNSNTGASICLINNNNTNDTAEAYTVLVTGIRMGNNCGFGCKPFYRMRRVSYIPIPKDAVCPSASIFADSALKCVVVPRTFTNADYLFMSTQPRTICLPPTAQKICVYSCGYLTNITFVDGAVITTDNANHGGLQSCMSLRKAYVQNNASKFAFRYCRSLAYVVIGADVTSIINTTFGDCSNLQEVHMRGTTPPSAGDSGIFSGQPSNFKIYVPYSADHSVLETYQTATNWSTYASYMVEEAQ